MAHMAKPFALSLSVLCGLRRTCSVGLTLSRLHVRKQAQTGAMTAQGCPVLEWLVLDPPDSVSSVPSPSPRQIGFQSVPCHSEEVLLSSPPLPWVTSRAAC